MAFLFFLFLGFSASAQEREITYAYPASKVLEIDQELLGKCLMLAAHDSTQRPRLDFKEVQLHPAISARYPKPDISKDGDFLDYLMATHKRWDWTSGKEKDLEQWILKQPDNSIDPVKIFQQAIELNKGNIWSSLLTVHQLLRQYARYYDRSNYPSQINKHESQIFWNKFIDIRGDLKERDPKEYKGDHEGSWYRIWGIMAYRLHSIPTDEKRTIYPGCYQSNTLLWKQHQSVRDMEGLLVAQLAESIKGIIMWNESDKRKAEINRKGTQAADKMIHIMRSPQELGDIFSLRKNCAARKYLEQI